MQGVPRNPHIALRELGGRGLFLKGAGITGPSQRRGSFIDVFCLKMNVK